MKKISISFFVTLVLSIMLSSLMDGRPNSSFMNTIYTVSGIMFSIGMGIICTAIPSDIKNKIYYSKIKENICYIRNTYTYWFILTTFLYLTYQIKEEWQGSFDILSIRFQISFSFISCIFIILSIVYFIINFFAIQKLNFEISEAIGRESELKVKL